MTSIAAGYNVTDAMLKASDVELMLSRSICSGKYMVMIRGDVGAVQAAVSAGLHAGNFSVIDSRRHVMRLTGIGKAFVTLTGNVSAVQSAVDAGAQVVGQKGMLVNKVVIPHPRPELLTEMI